jgi:hypothetical protein
MNSSGSRRWSLRKSLLIGLGISVAALGVPANIALQGVGAHIPVSAAPAHGTPPGARTSASASTHRALKKAPAPPGCSATGARASSSCAAPRQAARQTAFADVAVDRCWVYTQAGRSAQRIQSQAQALAASPCNIDSWIFQWSTLEPAEGQYDWQLVDAAINDSAATGKPVVLRVLAGIDSPSWVESVARMVTLPASGYMRAGVMPVPWDTAFLSVWDTFVDAFGARYDGNPHIALVETAGTGIYGETYLPGGPQLWNAAGYDEASYLAATEGIVATYVAAFPHTYLGLDVSLGVVGANQNVMVPLVSWVAKNLPTRVYVQQNGLSGSVIPGHQAVERAPLFGLQMVGPTTQTRTGGLCSAFAVALKDGAAYVEVYYSDATNSNDYAALRYLITGDTSAAC